MLIVATGARRVKLEIPPPETICTEKFSLPSARRSSVMLIETVVVGCPAANIIGSALARVIPVKSAKELHYKYVIMFPLIILDITVIILAKEGPLVVGALYSRFRLVVD